MDFCRDILLPKITSDKPSVDGGEVINLISSQNYINKSGFICESFVRTPADINVEFPIPIDIARIELNIEVGSRRSRGISILARLESDIQHVGLSSTSTRLVTLPPNGKKSSLCRSVSDSLLTKQRNVSRDDNFVCLGKWFADKESVIILKNFHYKHSLNIPLPCVKNDSTVYMGALRHPYRSPIIAVKALIIRILIVTPTGSPVLRSIHIWGQPSTNLRSTLTNKYIQLWAEQCMKDPNQSKEKCNLTTVSSKSFNTATEKTDLCENTTDASKLIDTEAIPDEFLDSLTFEIMTVPLLLPSGNSIDMYSLEKFIANEAIWGRSPSDPFTGVIFKEGYRPEPNVLLKSRIDRFLLMNKNSSGYITHYTVGSSIENEIRNCERKRIGEEIDEECSSIKRQKQNENIDKAVTNSSSSIVHPSTSFSVPSNKVCSNSLINNTKTVSAIPRETDFTVNSNGVQSRHTLVRALGNIVSSTSKNVNSLVTLKNNKEIDSKSSLPSPKNITSGDPSLIKPFSLDYILQGKKSCCCGQKETLYELSCSHLICRFCLTARPPLPFQAVQCIQCYKINHKHQINRYHPPSIFER